MFLAVVKEVPLITRQEIQEQWDANLGEITVESDFDYFCTVCNVSDATKERWVHEGGRFMYLSLLWSRKAFPTGLVMGQTIAYRELCQPINISDDDVLSAIETTVRFYRSVLSVLSKQSTVILGMDSNMLFTRPPTNKIAAKVYEELACNLTIIEAEVASFITAVTTQAKRSIKTHDRCSAQFEQHATGLSRVLLPTLWSYWEVIPPWDNIRRNSKLGKMIPPNLRSQLRTFYNTIRNRDKYKSYINKSINTKEI